MAIEKVLSGAGDVAQLVELLRIVCMGPWTQDAAPNDMRVYAITPRIQEPEAVGSEF